MSHILIIGGGVAGCTAAMELANSGVQVTLLESSERIGGKVRAYGCKATDRCNNCGVCLAAGLWDKVEQHPGISIMTGSTLKDVMGAKGNFRVLVDGQVGRSTLAGFESIIVTTGFDTFSSVSSGSVEHPVQAGIISGYRLEELLAGRDKAGILPEAPSSIAFIQCHGSRDIHEKAPYCSRVCCGYSTRAAKVLRQYYPSADITFFYMDLQRVEAGSYFDTLQKDNIEFVRCRPVKIIPGKPAKVAFEKPGAGGVTERAFDLIVLSEGIHPAADNDRLAELCMLGIDENGFLKPVKDGKTAGIYLAGCASGPKRIEEVRAEALTTARQLLAEI